MMVFFGIVFVFLSLCDVENIIIISKHIKYRNIDQKECYNMNAQLVCS
jgi:hypothetical protein